MCHNESEQMYESGEPMDKYQVLERYFGYTSFREGQQTLIDGILAGEDVLGIMPTGGGKSICYQVPAMLLPGITVVISPLISLMRDQVLSLKTAGIPAAYINSTLTGTQLQTVLHNLQTGKYKLLYVAPERLEYPGFLSVISKLQVSLVAVDEAHCVSQWGQDFRPSYLRIPEFICHLTKKPVVAAFTATATEQVRRDITRLLQLQDPITLVTGFDRPNLSFSVLHPKKKDAELLKLLDTQKNKSGIIYCATRKQVERVCEQLCEEGYPATRYHAGLEETERSENQEDFVFDRKSIMVATNAFGMGIDKSNVSFVIHYNMPKSPEAYYQEAGRAGRDGGDAVCVLLYSPGDVTTARFLIDNGEEQDPEQRAQDLKRLDAMVDYCKTQSCLRGKLLEYFGQEHPERCGNCGNCNTDFEPSDVTREAQMILSCICRIREKLGYFVGTGMVAKVLKGSRDKKLLQNGLDTLSTYKLMAAMELTKIQDLIHHLETQGYLQTEPEYHSLRLLPKAEGVLRGTQTVTMLRPKNQLKQKVRSAKSAAPQNDDLYEILRLQRLELAREAGIAPFMVCSNVTLQDMVRISPTTMKEFKTVYGIGEQKAARYGEIFLQKIRQYIQHT